MLISQLTIINSFGGVINSVLTDTMEAPPPSLSHISTISAPDLTLSIAVETVVSRGFTVTTSWCT